MLPLDKLTPAASTAIKDGGLSLDDMTVAVRMDLDLDGNFGEAWLVYEKDKRVIHRLVADPDSIPQQKHKHSRDYDDFGKIPDAEYVKYVDSFSMDYNSDLTVDTCMSSNRLLVFEHKTLCPEIPEDLEKEERDRISEEWNRDAITRIKAYCTNAKTKKDKRCGTSR